MEPKMAGKNRDLLEGVFMICQLETWFNWDCSRFLVSLAWRGVRVLFFCQTLVTLSTSKEVTGAASQQQQLKDMLYKWGNEEFLDISSYY